MGMLDQVRDYISEQMKSQHFNSIAVGEINFLSSEFESFEYIDGIFINNPKHFFDLASLTKPLTLSSTYLYDSSLFTDEMLLLLNHKAGLPVGGRIFKESWKEYLNEFQIKESETVYSDYSALRLQLEIEKKTGKSLQSLTGKWLDNDVKFWKDLKDRSLSPKTGERFWKPIQGEVHDPNAYVLNEFCSHAGLFGTISGVCRTLITLNKSYDLCETLQSAFKKQRTEDRFILGWDRVQDQENTLAGPGHGPHTFGHLGFTGTSIWIDADKKKGHVILSNGTESFWYDKGGLNDMRRHIGSTIISS